MSQPISAQDTDQSLFPIDSAFKRRWDWKYIKITNGYEKNEDGSYKLIENKRVPLSWKLDIKTKIKQDGDIKEALLDWWEFIQQINKIINNMTSSADKQLGYFFCKAEPTSKVISLETFVSKVIFYLWNDVFKDYGFEDNKLFKYKKKEDGKDVDSDLTFPDFYDEDGKVERYVVEQFVENIMNWKLTGKKEEE